MTEKTPMRWMGALGEREGQPRAMAAGDSISAKAATSLNHN